MSHFKAKNGPNSNLDGAVPQVPARGAYSTSPDPLAEFRAPREGSEGEERGW